MSPSGTLELFGASPRETLSCDSLRICLATLMSSLSQRGDEFCK